jgi:hypothetical protein
MSKPKSNATTFASGRRKTGGRRPGSVNKLARELKECLIQAALEFGEDGKGKDGVVGLFKRMIANNMPVYGMLLSRVLPTQINAAVTHEVEIESDEDISRELKRLGLPVTHIFDPAPIPMLELDATEIEPEDARRSEPQRR